jgi:hypothetical protein
MPAVVVWASRHIQWVLGTDTPAQHAVQHAVASPVGCAQQGLGPAVGKHPMRIPLLPPLLLLQAQPWATSPSLTSLTGAHFTSAAGWV